MSIERIRELNYLINEATKDDPDFEAFRPRLEVIFKDTAKYFQKAAREFGVGDPEITDAILVDMKDYDRLARLAKSGSREQIFKAWSDLDEAPQETVFDVMSKKDEKIFMKFMRK